MKDGWWVGEKFNVNYIFLLFSNNQYFTRTRGGYGKKLETA